MLCKVKGKIRPYPVQCSVAGKIMHENMIRYQWQSWEGIGQTGHCQQMPPFMSYFWFGKYGGIYEYIHIKNYTNEYPNIFSWIMNHNMIMIILNIEDDDDDDDYNSYDEDPSTCCGQCVRDKNSPVKLWNSYQNLELWNSYQNLKL